MKPYFEHEGITIYHGDCREILPTLPKVNLVLTDPPYNAENIGPNERVYKNQIMKLPEEEYKKFCTNWFKKINAITTIFTPGIANMCFYPQPKWAICWHKPAAVSFNRMGGYNAWEPIFIYGHTKHVRLGQDYILCNTLNHNKGGIEKGHPCPKPLPLWTRLLDTFLDEIKDSVVLDPFMGSGTTLRAAKNLNKQAIGIELEEKYCEIAAKRLSQEVFKF